MPSYIWYGGDFLNYLLFFLGIVLSVLFFLNIKSAANILCRIVGGFLFLIIYSTAAPMISLAPIGTNIVTAAICGLLEIPGFLLLLALNILL